MKKLLMLTTLVILGFANESSCRRRQHKKRNSDFLGSLLHGISHATDDNYYHDYPYYYYGNDRWPYYGRRYGRRYRRSRGWGY